MFDLDFRICGLVIISHRKPSDKLKAAGGNLQYI